MIISTFLQFLFISIWFGLTLSGSYYITEVKGVPKWLEFKPFICFRCLSFWSLLIGYICWFTIFGCQHYTFLIGGVILSILSAIAMTIDEKKRTITEEDLMKL